MLSNSLKSESSNSFDDNFSENSDEIEKIKYSNKYDNEIEIEKIKNNQKDNDENILIFGERKCINAILNNTNEKFIFEGFSRKSCDNLLCKKCDIKIKIRKNEKWKANCDYLFFRSNFGNPEKLKIGILKKFGFSSYHCGCIGVSIDKPVFIKKLNNINWICCGHNN